MKKFIKNLIYKLQNLTHLDKYILKQVIEMFIMGVLVFTSIIFASDTFITLIKQISMYGIPFKYAILMIILHLPEVFVMTIPMGVLLATVMTLNGLSLNSEITVMRACGIGLNRIAKPIFIFAIVMSCVSFVINETVVPFSTRLSTKLAGVAFSQKNVPEGKQNFTFKELKDGSLKRLFYIEKCENNTLKNVSVLDLSNKDTIQVIQSQSGKTSTQGWLFQRGAVYTISLTGKILNTTWFSESLVDFGLDIGDKLTEDEAQQYNVIALWKYIDNNRHKKDKKTESLFKIELYNKFAFPVTTVVLVLLGVPLAITPPRVRYNRGFLFSILILFLYYLLRALSLSFGEALAIPPSMAAWIPNIVLFTLGSLLYYKKVYTIN